VKLLIRRLINVIILFGNYSFAIAPKLIITIGAQLCRIRLIWVSDLVVMLPPLGVPPDTFALLIEAEGVYPIGAAKKTLGIRLSRDVFPTGV
jgi:hypothetical protein